MGKRGPRKRLDGRQRPFRTDRETEEALAADLAALRLVRPRATVSDVLRSWARAANRDRHVAHEAAMQALVDQVLLKLADAEAAAKAAQDELAGYRARASAAARQDVEVARKVLQNPANAHLVVQVRDLARLEAAGLQAPTPNPILQRARRQVSAWTDLLPDQPRDAP